MSSLAKALAVALFLTAPLAAPALAQAPAAPGKPDPAAVTGGSYKVDSDHTLVRWEVDHLGITPYTGLFGDVTGTLVLERGNPAASKVDITIPVAKVTTASPGLTEHLLRAAANGGKPDFFGPSPAPARFVATNIKIDGVTAAVTGNFTLNNVTRPVTLNVRFYGAGTMPAQMGGKENVGFQARTSIRRSDFGITTAIPMVSDEVRLEIVAAFAKE
ncbi:YceI family protein [Polymorphobacter sp.]|uniref:YceI family protein n=1 Tax=Polymorphobacter sp. TaxID=1909290 RepID=UPI003F714DA6